jgi:uncharacterized protein YndB with AHSA1/START domain
LELHYQEVRIVDEVSREVVVGAVREEVWSALVDPERLGEWLGEVLAIELRPGGELVLRMPGGEERHGFVEEVDPPTVLVVWWRPVDEDGGEGELTRVEFRLERSEDPEEGGTRLRVVESRPMARLDAVGIELPARERPSSGRRVNGGPLALVG